MSPTIGSSENLLKSRCIRLVPKTCIAISFARQSVSSTSSPSSSSVTSDNVACEHCDQVGRQSGTNQDSQSRQQQMQSPPLDRQSFSSISTGTTDNRDCLCQQPVNCVELFNDFVKENMLNTCLALPANFLSKLDLVGFIYPTTLIVAGPPESLKLLCSLWSRRLLKSPHGYGIRFIGHTSVLEVTTISQAHFTPLAEALHRCIDELNTLQLEATFDNIVRQLNVEFPSMELPSEEILKSSLSSLVSENKLSFDNQRQVYTTTRALLTPWDEFESLTLSDNFKPDREEDEIELEFKNVHSESINRCANLDQPFYLKSSTLSTETSSILDCKEDFLDSTKLLRRNSSLSNEIDKVNSEHRRANFKRSKSFKINYKPSSDDHGQHLTKDCTCNESIIKRQSLLSKLWKFGNSNGHLKARSVSSSSSVSSVKYFHFGSQFPEPADNSAVIPYNENYARKQVELHSKSTQTVKCGPEDIVTLIMKQAGKHATARNRLSHRHLERVQPEDCCANRLAAQHKCSACENGLASCIVPRYRNGSRKSRYRYYSTSGSIESGKCQCGTIAHAELAPSHHYQNQLRHRENNRYRKLRSSSLRHHRPNEWLIDYETVARNALYKVADKQTFQHGANKLTCVHSDEDGPNEEHFSNYEHKHLDLFGLNGKTLTIETNGSNYPNKINDHWQTDRNSSQYSQTNCVDTQNIFSSGNGLQPCGSVLINNSVNLKIEIETSNLVPPVPARNTCGSYSLNDSGPVNDIHSSNSGNKFAHFQVANTKHLKAKLFESKTNKTQFANDIYSELTFDKHSHKLSQVVSNGNFDRIELTNGNKAPYSPDLNYSNSITALKEQIARAKANFFNAPLSSSTTTRPLPASYR